MTIKYIAYTWPEYQEYMGEEWFREECYYCADKDIYFIPINRVNSTSAELKESNDKEIRKDIIRNLKRYIKYVKDGYDAPSAKNFVIKEIEKQIAWLEKQGEQKPADKLELKFKVGDWVVFDNGNVEHITSVGTHGYTFDDGDYLLHDECDKIAHLWTIEDAKEGDVLTWDDTTCVVLFKNIKNSKCFISYCFANDITFEIGTSHYIKGCHPATKEQRNTLMKAMTNAGYIFDFEKKESKKIETEIEIPFGAKDSELQEATYYIPKGFYAEINDDKVVIKKGKKPTAWSEDDERIRKRLINLVNEVYNNTNYITFLEHKELLAWLEKLDDNIEL